MTYSLSNNCTKNYYNRTLTVQVIVEDVVTWIFLRHSVERIENVQRRFTKRLPGLKNYKYTERLTILDLTSLEFRRLWFDLYWCYKLVFGLVDVHNHCNLFELKSDCYKGPSI